MKSRDQDKGRQLTSWSLSRGKPEPSIEDYIVNIDGSIKQSTQTKSSVVKSTQPSSKQVQTKKRLTSQSTTAKKPPTHISKVSTANAKVPLQAAQAVRRSNLHDDSKMSSIHNIERVP